MIDVVLSFWFSKIGKILLCPARFVSFRCNLDLRREVLDAKDVVFVTMVADCPYIDHGEERNKGLSIHSSQPGMGIDRPQSDEINQIITGNVVKP